MLTNGQQLKLQEALLIRYNVVVEEKASGKGKDYGHDLVFASRNKYYRALMYKTQTRHEWILGISQKRGVNKTRLLMMVYCR